MELNGVYSKLYNLQFRSSDQHVDFLEMNS